MVYWDGDGDFPNRTVSYQEVPRVPVNGSIQTLLIQSWIPEGATRLEVLTVIHGVRIFGEAFNSSLVDLNDRSPPISLPKIEFIDLDPEPGSIVGVVTITKTDPYTEDFEVFAATAEGEVAFCPPPPNKTNVTNVTMGPELPFCDELTAFPTAAPTAAPSAAPTVLVLPTFSPTFAPSPSPTAYPTGPPTNFTGHDELSLATGVGPRNGYGYGYG
jgi:hypothetical protein